MSYHYYISMSRFCNSALAGLFFAGLLMSIIGCKTPPPETSEPLEHYDPVASLHFVSIEANDTSRVNLDFVLRTEHIDSINDVVIEGWNVTINNETVNMTPEFGDGTQVMAGSREIPFRLELDIPALAAMGVPLLDDFHVELILNLVHNDPLHDPVHIQAREFVVFPFIREPVFSITAIAILQAELINTRFRVGIKIENPNHFPVDLSSFKYELYGNSRFWADGMERNMFTIPAKTTMQGDLYLLMNFIDMDRNLLNQIINLVDVNYRFKGEVLVTTGVDYLPQFVSEFDLSGYSVVLEN